MSIKTSNTDFKTRIRQQIEDPIMRKAVGKRAAAYWGQIGKKWSMNWGTGRSGAIGPPRYVIMF
ncbi:putative electron transport protein YkgF [Escherichia coli]|nr:putative electron transport protein YkgF [Escherichia coli]